MKASESMKDRKGRHVWDEKPTVVKTIYGKLTMWKSGVIGGVAECHQAELSNDGSIPGSICVELAEEYGLRHGNCIESSMIPKVAFDSSGYVIGYQWTYWPSTD